MTSSPNRAWAAELPRYHERLRRMAQSQLCSNAGEVRIRADVVEELLGGVFEEMLDAEAPRDVWVVMHDTSDEGEPCEWDACAAFTDMGAADRYAMAVSGRTLATYSHVPVNPDTPDSWDAIERDAADMDAEAWCDRDAAPQVAELVRRCKKLAGVE